MAGREYFLLVGVYRDRGEAAADLRELTQPGPLASAVGGVGLLSRNLDRGELHALGGGTLAYSIGTGAAAGVAVGGLLGIPVRAMALGAAVGALVGRRTARRLVADSVRALSDAVPVGTTALVAVADVSRTSELHAALRRSLRSTGRVLDGGPLIDLAHALARGNPSVTERLDAQESPPHPMS